MRSYASSGRSLSRHSPPSTWLCYAMRSYASFGRSLSRHSPYPSGGEKVFSGASVYNTFSPPDAHGSLLPAKNPRSYLTRDFVCKSVKFTFASGFRFFLTPYARLFIMFSFANLLLDACLCAISFETTQSAVQSLILFNDHI